MEFVGIEKSKWNQLEQLIGDMPTRYGAVPATLLLSEKASWFVDDKKVAEAREKAAKAPGKMVSIPVDPQPDKAVEDSNEA